MLSTDQDMGNNPTEWAATDAFWKARGGLWEVDASWTAKHEDDLVIVDVRQPSEFNDALGHITTAQLLPLSLLEAKALDVLDRNAQVVVVCRSGARSLSGASMLTQLGFTKVASMAGGMVAWNRLGHPTARS